MRINEPQFCRSCKEICYSRLCPYCEKPVGAMDLDPQPDTREIQVDEGEDENYDAGVVALNFDEVYGSESD